jgi:hypothetical protein
MNFLTVMTIITIMTIMRNVHININAIENYQKIKGRQNLFIFLGFGS